MTPENGAQNLIHYKWAWLGGVYVRGFRLIAPTFLFYLIIEFIFVIWCYICTKKNQTFNAEHLLGQAVFLVSS